MSQFETGSLLEVPFGEWARVLELPPAEVYRVRQIQEWIFAKRAKTFSAMTTLPQALRERLDKQFRLRTLRLVSQETSARDGTQRLFFKTMDDKDVSAVFLPGRKEEEDGEEEAAPESSAEGAAARQGRGNSAGRYSLCMSTQVGCAWGCVFCASGLVKFQRNLTAAEIMDQLMLAEEATGKKVSSLLFMGMGEPLANYNNLLWALRCFRAPGAFNYGARHVTVSTSGLVPQVLKLAEEGPKVNLAVSLHAADDVTRARILPKSSQWPMKDLLKASWAYQKTIGGGRVTFEYILLKGVNDSLRAAQRLSNLLRDKKAWVNLIAYNPVPGLKWGKPDPESVRKFAEVLSSRGIFVRVRKPQGTDIAAGCGQLGKPQKVA
jgi:23S rRNA (adenine2503-C2)-methyltransferase